LLLIYSGLTWTRSHWSTIKSPELVSMPSRMFVYFKVWIWAATGSVSWKEGHSLTTLSSSLFSWTWTRWGWWTLRVSTVSLGCAPSHSATYMHQPMATDLLGSFINRHRLLGSTCRKIFSTHSQDLPGESINNFSNLARLTLSYSVDKIVIPDSFMIFFKCVTTNVCYSNTMCVLSVCYTFLKKWLHFLNT